MSTPWGNPVAELAAPDPKLPPADAERRLLRLLHKYELLLALSRGEPGRTAPRRDAMRAIAQRFPAALREWDELPPEELARRHRVVAEQLGAIERLGALATSGESAEDWLRYGLDLHDCLRAVLQLRRYLSQEAGGRLPRGLAKSADLVVSRLTEPTPDRLAACRDLVGACDVPWLTVTPALLQAIAEPAFGRLTALAYQAVAERHGTSPAAIKIALFGQAARVANAPR